MTFQQLQAYITVCETNNFAEAARKLNIYPSNLSYIISEFETSLDVVLLNRSKKGVFPNVFGKEVYRRAKDIMELSASCSASISEIGQAGKFLTVTYSRQFCIADFQPALKRLGKELQENGISLNLLIPNDQTMAVRALQNRKADFAILYDAQLSDYEKVLIGKDSLTVALPSGHHLAKRDSLSLSDLKNETILLCNDGNLWDEYVKELFLQSNLAPSGFSYCYNQHLLYEFIHYHGYCSIVSSLPVGKKLPGISYVPLQPPFNEREIYAVYPKNSDNQELIEKCLRYILQ